MLEAKKIYKIYDNKVVLKNISLKINKNETTLIIGPSGSGKTTLLKCLNYLIKPDKGEIIFDGQKVCEENINQIREKVGMVFQNFNLFPHLTIKENLILVPTKKKYLNEIEATKKAKKLLKEFDILDKLDEYPDNLSGGEQQRVAIARAIVNEPKLLICDEPTGNLDPVMSQEIVELLDTINKKEGTTVIMVTHDKTIVNSMKKHVIALKEGHLFKDYKEGEYVDEIL